MNLKNTRLVTLFYYLMNTSLKILYTARLWQFCALLKEYKSSDLVILQMQLSVVPSPWLYPRGLCSERPCVLKLLTMYHSQPTDFCFLTCKRWVPLCVCVCARARACFWVRQKIISTPLSLLLFHFSLATPFLPPCTLCVFYTSIFILFLHYRVVHFFLPYQNFHSLAVSTPKFPHASTAPVDTHTPLIYITSNSLPYPGDSYISYRRLYFFP